MTIAPKNICEYRQSFLQIQKLQKAKSAQCLKIAAELSYHECGDHICVLIIYGNIETDFIKYLHKCF